METCRRCELYEKRRMDVNAQRIQLWRRGELTEGVEEKLKADEHKAAEDLKTHQAKRHLYSVS
jgi:hypothetical protein